MRLDLGTVPARVIALSPRDILANFVNEQGASGVKRSLMSLGGETKTSKHSVV
jgi:hypothetical protein